MDAYVLAAGLITGALYATTGVGISIIYRSSRLLNFALAGTSTLAVYVATQLVSPGAPVALVVLIAVLAGALAGGLSEVLLGPLRHYPPMTAGIATLGVLLIFQGTVAWIWDYEPRRVSWLADSRLHISVPGGRIGALQLVALAIAIVAIGLVYVFVEKTKYGLALRMSSSGPITAQLLGVNIWRTRRMSWVIGGAMGGVAALMVTALTYLDPAVFTGFMIVAFVATVLGGFTNFIGVALGGVVVGVLVNVFRVEFSTELTQTYTLVLIALVLAVKPNGLLGRPEKEVPEPDLPSVGKGSLVSRLINRRNAPSEKSVGRRVRSVQTASSGSSVGKLIVGALVVVLLIALPRIVSVDLVPILPTAMTTFIAVLGLNMLVGYGGQFSVGHSAFMAIGAYSGALSVQNLGVPPLLGIVVGLVSGLVIGAIVGLPVTRLDGVFLTIVTITLPLVVTELALLFDEKTGGATGMPYTFPDWLFSSENQYWFGLAIASVCALAVFLLRRSTTGHRWIAVRDALPGAQSIGINVMWTRLGAFSIGCGLAGLAGSLDAGFVGSVGPTSYSTWLSIYLLAAVIIGGSGSIPGSLLGSFFIVLIPHFVAGTSIPPDLLFGVALLAVMIVTPRGLVFVANWLVESAIGLITPASRKEAAWDPSEEFDVLHETDGVPVEPALAKAKVVDEPVGSTPPLLKIRDLRAGYGQISVLRGVDLTIQPGDFTALIGANGAGKTTLLRAVSGLIRADDGEIDFHGESLVGQRADQIARLGIAHVPEGRGVFPDLTVKENLLAGRFSSTDREPDVNRALEVFPQLTRLVGRVAGTLSGGEQQMVAVARAIATRPRLLMLDEPSLGLSPKASKDLFEILGQLKGSDLTVLLIEQNARAAISLADSCCLFGDGVIVREGPSASFEDDHMVATYLGVTV